METLMEVIMAVVTKNKQVWNLGSTIVISNL